MFLTDTSQYNAYLSFDLQASHVPMHWLYWLDSVRNIRNKANIINIFYRIIYGRSTIYYCPCTGRDNPAPALYKYYCRICDYKCTILMTRGSVIFQGLVLESEYLFQCKFYFFKHKFYLNLDIIAVLFFAFRRNLIMVFKDNSYSVNFLK